MLDAIDKTLDPLHAAYNVACRALADANAAVNAAQRGLRLAESQREHAADLHELLAGLMRQAAYAENDKVRQTS